MNAHKAVVSVRQRAARHPTTWLVVLLLTTLAGGCTTRNWYEGVQQNHRQRCEQVPESSRAECLAQHDDHYEDYQHKRGEITQ